MADDRVSVGFVTSLDFRHPYTDPHALFQAFKTHPFVRAILEGGEMEGYGAKTLPLGGWFSMPRRVLPGALIVGDAAAFLNPERLKGIHLAMESGMLAAQAVFQALLAEVYDEEQLSLFDRFFAASPAREELHRSRNFHQGFQGGRWAGIANAMLLTLTGGRALGGDKLGVKPDHTHMRRLSEVPPGPPIPSVRYDNQFTFDKLTDVYRSGTQHEEDQPVHLLVADTEVCATRCAEEYGNPCRFFCPAAVYEMVETENPPGRRLQINASNCVHCKTCDIADPYELITWVPPEGGGGPNYRNL
jgi:electron-transferring-flavoprotein dehydrogenase